MKHWSIFLLSLPFSSLATVTPESCLDINRSIGISMTDAMVKDLKINEQALRLDKTKIVLLDTQNVTEEMAELYAQQDKEEFRFPASKLNRFISIYKEANPKNIIIKYDYVNKQNKHNIFIASLLVNDNECSVRFNGYILVRREF